MKPGSIVSAADFEAQIAARAPRGSAAAAELRASVSGLAAVYVSPAILAQLEALGESSSPASASPPAPTSAPSAPSRHPAGRPVPEAAASLPAGVVPVASFEAMIAERAPDGGEAADALRASVKGLAAVYLTDAVRAQFDALGASAAPDSGADIPATAPAVVSPTVTAAEVQAEAEHVPPALSSDFEAAVADRIAQLVAERLSSPTLGLSDRQLYDIQAHALLNAALAEHGSAEVCALLRSLLSPAGSAGTSPEST